MIGQIRVCFLYHDHMQVNVESVPAVRVLADCRVLDHGFNLPHHLARHAGRGGVFQDFFRHASFAPEIAKPPPLPRLPARLATGVRPEQGGDSGVVWTTPFPERSRPSETSVVGHPHVLCAAAGASWDMTFHRPTGYYSTSFPRTRYGDRPYFGGWLSVSRLSTFQAQPSPYSVYRRSVLLRSARPPGFPFRRHLGTYGTCTGVSSVCDIRSRSCTGNHALLTPSTLSLTYAHSRRSSTDVTLPYTHPRTSTTSPSHSSRKDPSHG